MTTMFGINSSISSMLSTDSAIASYQNQIDTKKRYSSPLMIRLLLNRLTPYGAA